jgi:hypothetical protein
MSGQISIMVFHMTQIVNRTIHREALVGQFSSLAQSNLLELSYCGRKSPSVSRSHEKRSVQRSSLV